MKRESLDERDLLKDAILARMDFVKTKTVSPKTLSELEDLSIQIDWISQRSIVSKIILEKACILIDEFLSNYLGFLEDSYVNDETSVVVKEFLEGIVAINDFIRGLDNNLLPYLENTLREEGAEGLNEIASMGEDGSYFIMLYTMQKFITKRATHYEVLDVVIIYLCGQYYEFAINDILMEFENLHNEYVHMIVHLPKLLEYDWPGIDYVNKTLINVKDAIQI